MTPMEIKVELLKKGISMSAVGRHLNPPVSPSAVSQAIHRKYISNRIMRAVADAIGKDVRYVFSDYYFKKTG